MLLVKVELKKCELFLPGYFGESRFGDREISRKYAISVQYGRSIVYPIALREPIFTSFPRTLSQDWCLTCK
jgi:hypothetical protein